MRQIAQRSKQRYRIEWQVIMGNITVAGQQYFWGGTIAAISAVSAIVTTSAAQAAPLENFQYNAQSNQLSFVLPDGVKPRYFVMAQPARIVMDIPDTQVGDLPAEQTFSGAVSRIEVTQVQPQLLRVILEMSPQAVFARGQVSLENVGDAAPGKDLWLLMPLLANQVASQPKTLDSATPPTATVLNQASQPNQSAPSVQPPASAKSSSSVAEGQPPSQAKSVISVPKSVPSVELPQSPETAVVGQSAPEVELPPGMEVELPPGMESVVGELPSPSETAADATESMPLSISPTTGDRQPEAEIPIAIEVPIVQPSVESTTPNVPPPPPTLQAPSTNGTAVTSPAADTAAAIVTPDPVMRSDLQPMSEPPIATEPTVSVPPLASITDVSSSPPDDTGESVQTPLPQTTLPQTTLPQATSGQDSFNALEQETTAISVPQVGSVPTTQDDLPPLPPIASRSGRRAVPATVAVPSTAAAPSSILPNSQPTVTATRPAATVPALPDRDAVVEFGQLPGSQVSGSQVSGSQATVTTPVTMAAPKPTATVVEFGQLPGSQSRVVNPVTAVTPVATTGQLPSGHSSVGTPVQAAAPGTTGVVEFGQSLSGTPTMAPLTPGLQSTLPSSSAIVAADSLPTGGVVIPAGTMFNLRYDQNEPLKLKPGQRQQGILSLQSPIVDTRGQVVVPQGSVVLGEFDTNPDGSRFTTQALSIANRSLPFNTQSELLAVKKRVPSANQFLRNTGIGAGAGAVTGAIAGAFAPLLFGGAAAGAAITYLIAPKEAIIQPGQILQVKLMQDFFSNPQ